MGLEFEVQGTTWTLEESNQLQSGYCIESSRKRVHVSPDMLMPGRDPVAAMFDVVLQYDKSDLTGRKPQIWNDLKKHYENNYRR